jgi:hypothetical protein
VPTPHGRWPHSEANESLVSVYENDGIFLGVQFLQICGYIRRGR